MTRAAWRPEDEALYQRLADRRRLERLWASEDVDAPAPHPRAAGLITLLRETPEGVRAAELADDGDLGPLRALVGLETLEGRRPPLLHHLALYHERLARLRGRADDWRRALAAWAALAQRADYLRELADAVAADALDDATKERWAAGAAWQAWDRLVARGEDGAAERSAEAATALSVVADIGPIADRAGADEDEREALARRARSARTRILDAALRPIDERLDEAESRSADAEHVTALESVVHLWRWAGKPAQVERFFVDRALSIGWELYKAKKFVSLRRLNEVARPLLDRFAERVAVEPREVSYASRVAQFLVFRAELEPRFERQLEAAEQAVRVCDTHRNGRLVCADLLAERALRTLERAPLVGRRSHVARARADVERARSLWAETLPRLEQAEAALAKERGR